jgi:hypothetical protein
MRKFTTFLHTLFGLRVYGDSLLFPIVRSTMTAFCIVLLLQAIVDGYAWTQVFGYALPDLPFLSIPIGLAFMIMIIVVDRFLIVADTSGSRRQVYPLLGRVLFLLFLSVITAVSFEISMFKGEINERMDARETSAINTIRKKAITLEEEKFDRRMADASNLGNHVVTADQAKLDQDIITFQADADKRRALLVDDLDKQSTLVAMEAAGKGPSGRYGQGDAFQAMKDQETALRNALVAHDATTQTHLDELRKQRDTVIEGGRAKGEGDVSKLRADKDAKLEEVRNMDPDALSKKYQGENWRINRGFLNMYTELETMSDEIPEVRKGVWGCRAVMIVFGLAILLIKLFAPLEFRRYYSVGAQAAQGNEEALKVLAGMGHSAGVNTKNLGLTPEVLDLQNAWSAAYFRFLEAVLSARKAVSGLVKMNDKGLYPERHILDRDMRTEWVDKVLPAFETLQNVELRMSLRAAPIPSWPSNAPISDPRGIQDPWLWSDDQLRELGWVNPDEAIIHGREALGVLEDLYRELRELTNGEFTSTLIELVQRHPTEKRGFFTDRMFTFYRVEILPFMNRLEAAEGMVRRGGLEVLPLPADLPSRNTLHTMWRVDEKDLRQYGWTGPTPVVQRRTIPTARPPRRPIPAPLPEQSSETHNPQPTSTRRPGDTLEMPAIPPAAVADPPTNTVPLSTTAPDDFTDVKDDIEIEEETEADRRAAEAVAASPINGKIIHLPGDGTVQAPKPRTGPPPIPPTT